MKPIEEMTEQELDEALEKEKLRLAFLSDQLDAATRERNRIRRMTEK